MSFHLYSSTPFIIIIIKALFNQVNPIEIKNLFFEGDPDRTGNNLWNAFLQTKNTEQEELKETKS